VFVRPGGRSLYRPRVNGPPSSTGCSHSPLSSRRIFRCPYTGSLRENYPRNVFHERLRTTNERAFPNVKQNSKRLLYDDRCPGMATTVIFAVVTRASFAGSAVGLFSRKRPIRTSLFTSRRSLSSRSPIVYSLSALVFEFRVSFRLSTATR